MIKCEWLIQWGRCKLCLTVDAFKEDKVVACFSNVDARMLVVAVM